MTMDIPPYISVSILNNPSFTCAAAKEDQNQNVRVDHGRREDASITIIPKKRSFDVAFLISSDNQSDSGKSPPTSPEPSPSPNDTIRSAFRKVGLGFPKYDSRSSSPIDPIRTPSPDEVPDKMRRSYSSPIFHPFGLMPPRQSRSADTSPMNIVSNNFLNPAGVSRSSFLPSPIFATNSILPTGFVTASLLPPSLAALTLPAQNVCAKCNVSFRMTSDLVYHMRSHHKNDHTSPDQLRRRRELDKLKCPVCNESFRERHHLTRHMTAHQDKEGDHLEKADRGCRMKFCDSKSDFQ